MLDDSAKSLEVKDRFRQGKMGGSEFTRVMADLKRSGADRIERTAKRNAAFAGARPAAVSGVPGLTVSTASSTPMVVTEPYQGRDGRAAGAGRGAALDSSRFADFGPTGLKLKRPANSSGVLSKLGGRLVSGLTKAEQASGSNSPTAERVRSETGGLRRLRSPRRASSVESPRHRNQEPGASESAPQTGSSWRPWSVPRSDRRLASSASSPERAAPSPADTGTPLRGGDASEQARNTPTGPSQPQRLGLDGGGGGGGDGGASGGGRGTGSATGSAVPGPLTASEIDNLSSVSTTSTVLTDLSLRMEKIEDLLARLLEASTGSKGAGGGNDTLDRWGRVLPGRSGSHDTDAGSSEIGTGTAEAAASASRPPSTVLNKESAGELMGEVKDTAAELRQVRGRLRQLELEDAAAKAAAAASHSAAPRGASSTVGPRSPQPSSPSGERKIAQSEAVTSGGIGGVTGGSGEHFIQGVVPASELPACRNDSGEEEELLRLSAAAKEKQSETSSSRPEDAAAVASGRSSDPPASAHADEGGAASETDPGGNTKPTETRGGSGHPEREHARSSHDREDKGEEKVVGITGGGKEDEAKAVEPDDTPPRGGGRSGPLVGGGALRRARSFGLSPISEASS